MSRDQRPGRAVMVDSGPDPLEAKRLVAVDGDPALASPVPEPVTGNARLFLSSIVFLIACVAGACVMALLPLGKIL